MSICCETVQQYANPDMSVQECGPQVISVQIIQKIVPMYKTNTV